MSRSFSKSEKNYSQLEKEKLSRIFWVKKFHSYLIGHHFLLYTDHKSWLALLNAQHSTSPQASSRIHRWSISLSSYEYDLEFCKTSAHTNADALSWLPLPVCPAEEDQVPEIVLLLDHLSDSSVTAHQIKMATACDPFLSSVLCYICVGWPSNSSVGPDLSSFSLTRQNCQYKMGAFFRDQELSFLLPIMKDPC